MFLSTGITQQKPVRNAQQDSSTIQSTWNAVVHLQHHIKTPKINALLAAHLIVGTARPFNAIDAPQVKLGTLPQINALVLHYFLGLIILNVQLALQICQYGTVRNAWPALIKLSSITTQKLVQPVLKDCCTIQQLEHASSRYDWLFVSLIYPRL